MWISRSARYPTTKARKKLVPPGSHGIHFYPVISPLRLTFIMIFLLN
jgi:hypothetical protein